MFSYLSRLFSLLSFRILLITLSYAKKQKKRHAIYETAASNFNIISFYIPSDNKNSAKIINSKFIILDKSEIIINFQTKMISL